MNLHDPFTQFIVAELTQIGGIVIGAILGIAMPIIISKPRKVVLKKPPIIKPRLYRSWARYLSLLLISLIFTPGLAFVTLVFWYGPDRFFAVLLGLLAACFFVFIPISIAALAIGEPAP